MDPEPVITLRNVSVAYDGPLVLEGVDLTIAERDFVCIIGPNGGGKTTLLKVLLGLVTPRTGQVRVLGRDAARARADVGYMPQHVRLDPQFPVNVMDVVLMGRLGKERSAGPYSRSDRAVATRALEEVGLVDLRTRGFSSLSGGQQQRALIARALACEPKLLLLDEPMANLDAAVQDDLYGLLRTLNQRLTVAIVSHDIGFVSVFFKTVVCVNRTAHMHPSSELTTKTVADMYGREVRLLHHPAAMAGGAGS